MDISIEILSDKIKEIESKMVHREFDSDQPNQLPLENEIREIETAIEILKKNS